jgi:hypothetical protein
MYPHVTPVTVPAAFLWLILSLLESVNAGAVFIFTGGKITRVCASLSLLTHSTDFPSHPFNSNTNGYFLTLKLSSTLLIPSPPTALQGQAPNWKIQATWAGLQPLDQSCVLQNVVGNSGDEVGHWHHIPSFYDGATKPSYTELYFEERQPEGT